MGTLNEFLARTRPPRTPALVVRRSALMANLSAMQQACDAAGMRLRPHGKMAKCSRLAQAQIELGAVGLCCQTVGEAEAYTRAGLRDLLLSAPVPPWGWPVLADIAATGVAVSAVVDSVAQIAAASAGGAKAVSLLVDVDGGQHRSGAAFADAPELVEAVVSAGFRWAGLQCYLGHLQAHPARAEAHAAAMQRLGALVAELAGAGRPPQVVTGGGTGTAPLDLASGLFTELQAGSYALMDVQYAAAAAAFEPALFCAATVVSSTRKSHITVDAGLKALAADGPSARLIAGAPEGCRFRFMGDEHGALIHPAAVAAFAEHGLHAVDRLEADAAIPRPEWPADGALIWLQPGHVDPTVNLHDALWLADEDGTLERWPIDARRVTA
jgi:D-serine deaminase-like pyridoxal phosphate-dependent protein